MAQEQLLRRSLLIVIGLTVSLSAVRGQFDDGFMGRRWGTPLEEMEQVFGLTLTAERGRTFQFSANVQRVAGVELSSCEFEFTSGKFSGVVLMTADRKNSHRLLALLEKTYGRWHEDEILGRQWFHGRTHASYDEGSDGNAYVYIYYLSLAGL
jgi:hypothetical protein